MAIERRAASGQNAPASAAASTTHRVATTDFASKNLFYGDEDNARAWIQRNYPRLHVTPGDDWGDAGPMPEVVLVGQDGLEEYWNGEKWIKEDAPTAPEVSAPAVTPDIPAGQKAHWDGEAWVLAEDDGVPDETGVTTVQPDLATEAVV